jgi:CBS-domain-containing membrane protein
MTRDALYCFENEPVGAVAQKMADWWVRRLPVVNRDKRLIGMVSLADVTASNVAPRAKEVDTRSRRRQPARSVRQTQRAHSPAVAVCR